VAATAAESAKTVEFRRTEDHDLLIRLEEKMGGLKADIQELKEGHAGKIENHEARLKAICEWRARIDGPDGCLEKIPKYESRILGLENSRLEFKTQIKTWIIIGGCIISAIMFIIDKVLPALR
jgi:oligoribonuclease (3'-5' exoribonuclease)